ncbi:MAG TPA: DNA alkylation repair enzyme [Hyphomonadaceae bacterium]|nr:DNA alkylation repair enzyme [Hyphomonadaceae bacterium]
MAAKAKKAAAKKKRADSPPSAAAILRDLERNGSKQYFADMSARYGIVTKAKAYGVPVVTLRRMAKSIGRNHDLADALWRTGVHDARMLATMIGDPALVTPALMDRWAKDFDNWGIVDTACFTLFDHSPHAFKQIAKWAEAKDEFVKRAAFALIASAALHRKVLPDEPFLKCLPIIEIGATDGRNFVKKGVSWGLRAIGKRKGVKMRAAALAVARRLAASEDAPSRWVGKDALRDLEKA